MTDNTTKLLPISKARAAGERLGLRTMIVLQELPSGQWGYTSWGKTRADCKRGQKIGDSAMEAAILESVFVDNTP